MTNVVEWQLKISESGAAKLAMLIDKIAGAGSAAAVGVGDLGVATEKAAAAADSMASSGAAAQRITEIGEASRATTKHLDELRAAARNASAPTDQERMINAARPSDLIAQEGAIKRHLALMEKLRAASRASAGATDAEKMIGAATPAHLKAAPNLSLPQRAVRKVLQELNASTGGAAFRGIARVQEGLDRLRPAMGFAADVGSELAPVFGKIGSAASSVLGIMGPLTSATLAAGGAMAALTAGAAIGGAKLVSSVVKAQAHREDLTLGLRLIQKSDAAAWNTLQTASKTADMIGASRSETTGQYLDLLTKGFDIGKTDEIVKRLADMSKVDPKAQMEGLTRAIGQIKGNQRLQFEEINQLADAGLERGAVVESVSKLINKPIDQTMKLIEAGKVDADTGIAAILDAIKTQTGNKGAGEVAKEASKGLSGMTKRLENFWGNLTFSMDAREGLGSVRSSLGAINDLLDLNTDSGKKFMTAIEGTFGALAAGFVEGFGGKAAEGPDALRQNITKVLDAIIAAKPDIKEFAASLGRAADAGLKLAGAFSDSGAIGKAFKVAGAFVDVGIGAGSAVADKGRDVSNIGRVIQGKPPEVMAAEQRSAYSTVGSAIVDGIIGGIGGGTGGFIQALTNLSQLGIAAFQTENKIQSPSKVYEGLGAFIPMGLERGIAANSNGIFDAMLGVADIEAPNLAGIASGAAAVAGRATGAGGFSVGDIYVDARGAQEPQRVAELVREEVIRTLESFALSTGAAA